MGLLRIFHRRTEDPPAAEDVECPIADPQEAEDEWLESEAPKVAIVAAQHALQHAVKQKTELDALASHMSKIGNLNNFGAAIEISMRRRMAS